MGNIYMTTESETKLKLLYTNIKYFYILDVASFIKSLNIDMTKKTSVWLVNEEIRSIINALLKLKKYKGIIYINKNLDENLCFSFKNCFNDNKDIKFVLIDNGQFPKHTDLMDSFDEVIFYERFRKNKITECDGFDKQQEETSGEDMETGFAKLSKK